MHIRCKDLCFSYDAKPLLSHINLEVPAHSHLWIKGRSGSGKSSFLKLLAGLLPPRSGEIQYTLEAPSLTNTITTTTLSLLRQTEQDEFRRRHIGFLHQENHLISHWTVEQNLNLANYTSSESAQISPDLLLSELGLVPVSDRASARENKIDHSRIDEFKSKLAADLSGGERQRVSLARLFLQAPKIALLDEPTSHLDDETAERVMSLIGKYLKNSTALIVSHDQRLARYFSSPIAFADLQSPKSKSDTTTRAPLQTDAKTRGEQK